MKLSISFISFVSVAFISCSNKEEIPDYSNYTQKEFLIAGLDTNFKQTDTLAKVFIQVPNQLDTFYQWQNSSDCTQCGWFQYRFANSRYKQYAESGFFWNHPLPDSVYQLTIRHKPKKDVPESIILNPMSSSDSGHLGMLINGKLCDTSNITHIKFATINDKNFWIVQVSNACNLVTEKEAFYIAAITNLRDRWFEIIGECRGKDTTGFRNMIYKSIKSIKIVEKE